jgi:hypothetical protein
VEKAREPASGTEATRERAAQRSRETTDGVSADRLPIRSSRRLLALQRSVGNRAVAGLLQRQDTGTATAETWRAPIDQAIADGDPEPIYDTSVAILGRLTEAERVGLLQALIGNRLSARGATVVRRIWSSFRPNLTRMAVEHSDLFDRCNTQGARMPAAWLGSASGHREVAVTEQVGGWEYGVTGAYDFRVRSDRINVRVPIAFTPDQGVTVPTATWFGFVQTTWNHYSAVDQADRTRRKRIEFDPVSSPSGYHSVRVAAGNGRANAGLFYAGDANASQTIPHEFGHLIGLEDEYERDAGAYRRVTEQGPQAGDPALAGRARGIAEALHWALFQEEGFFERHTTATARRRDAVKRIFNTERLPQNYSSPLTRQIVIEYRRLCRRSISRDIVRQIDEVRGDQDAFRNWREAVVGVFQYTSTSIMGLPGYASSPGVVEHTHGVEARHVRRFARHVQEALGGNWQPERTH